MSAFINMNRKQSRILGSGKLAQLPPSLQSCKLLSVVVYLIEGSIRIVVYVNSDPLNCSVYRLSNCTCSLGLLWFDSKNQIYIHLLQVRPRKSSFSGTFGFGLESLSVSLLPEGMLASCTS